MRVVAGFLRGRKIISVPGKNTRPTLDQVKEALFNILGQFFTSGKGLDLFAGSGSLGIEAISRGLEKCVFVDKDFKSYQVIKENLQLLNIEQKSEVYKMDYLKALKYFQEKKEKFDYVFLDPPYHLQKMNEIMKLLVDYDLLNEDAIVTCESLKEEDLIDSYQSIKLKKVYYYGISKITIYQKGGVFNE